MDRDGGFIDAGRLAQREQKEHPYTAGLLGSRPVTGRRDRLASPPGRPDGVSVAALMQLGAVAAQGRRGAALCGTQESGLSGGDVQSARGWAVRAVQEDRFRPAPEMGAQPLSQSR